MALESSLAELNSSSSIYVLPSSYTVLGSDTDLVCKRKPKRGANETRIICTSDKNEKIRILILYILDHCIDKLHILSGGIAVTGEDPHLAFFDNVLKKRFAASETAIFDPIYDIETGGPFRKIQMNKIYNDSAKLKEFIHAIKNEIKEFHTFQIFRNVMFDVKLKIQETQTLFKETNDNQNKFKELRYTIATYGRNSNLQIHEANDAYQTACDTVQNLLFKNIVKLRYAKAYENSRREQNKIKGERECRILQSIISKYKEKMQLENRVHYEILNYISVNEKELNENIKIWVDKYKLDMEANHLKCLQIKDGLEDLKKYKKKLQITFADHKKSIEEFKDYKEKKRIKDDEKQRLVDAATKIQAWWRGNMYRHKLGPYNTKKSKKGKGKKKKKNQ